ncbi:MAG: VWA domain-containing protein, partial [bacterium]
MHGARYISWDGSQTLQLDPETLFEELARGLSETDDTALALERMLREGVEVDELRIMGLDELRQLLAEARRELERLLGEDPSPDVAADLIERLETLDKLDAALAAGDLEGADSEALGALLGERVRGGLDALKGMVLVLLDAGYLREKEGRVELSPRAVRKIGQLALRDIYEALLRDRAGAHAMREHGGAEPTPDRIRPWEFGDALDLALVPTLMHAVRRAPATPIQIVSGDFTVREAEHATSASTVLLLDMSWSMSWEGRFVAAKKVALALETLVHTRFPHDYFGIVGFHTRAVELSPRTLPEATWSMGDPFTNLQDGLRMASKLLRRHPSRNQQVILITDGQPTAYFADGRLHCEWPLALGGVSRRAAEETLKEVAHITRQGITINTFMLDDADGLRAFVDRLTKINKGRALY